MTPISPPPLPHEVDGIFVGGGHNSLVAASYLARAGASVLVLEGGDELGGGVRTEEVTLPLFRHNLHAFFVRWTPDYTIWHDLGLDRFGVEAIYPDVQNAVPYDGGERALVTYRDVEKSTGEIARLNPEDSEAYRRLHSEFSEITNRILGPLRFAPPLPADLQRELLGQSALGRRLLSLADRSALDVIRDAFTSEPLRALVGFNVAVRGYLPVLDVPGTGYCPVLALPNSHEGRMIRGGSGEMARALAASVYANGGRLATRSPVASIDIQNGRAVGVTTIDGREVGARSFVASSVPAPSTMLDLVGKEVLDPGMATAMEEYQWLEEALFGIHLALGDRPKFASEAHNPDVPRALNLALGYESSDDLIRDMTAIRGRTLPEVSALHSSIPTLNDPTQAPEGRHTTFGWQFVPSTLPDGTEKWESPDRDRQTDLMLSGYERYAPGLSDRILAVEAHSPADTEATVPSMRRGDRHHGSFHPDNWETNRPHHDLSSYRTPIDGLYLCGSSQHPGGSFTGQPGHNAAGVIADDTGLNVWWNRPNAVEVLRDL
ncbi:MAG: NAD(P)-binding protein [Acidimicrobiia bacterium]|nr:NAD(P)-binding protein [Acidimicrobiia bacterium]